MICIVFTARQRSFWANNATNFPKITRLIGFSCFEFKIRLIRRGISFQKQKFLYLNSQPTDSQSGVITITPKSQL